MIYSHILGEYDIILSNNVQANPCFIMGLDGGPKFEVKKLHPSVVWRQMTPLERAEVNIGNPIPFLPSLA